MNTGDNVADFELDDQNGNARKLSEFLDHGPVVLFFYPAALSMGCTAESCHFRDLAAEFAKVGAQRVGISGDSVDKQKQFSDKHSFDYPLLSDRSGDVARQFGVKAGFNPMQSKRKTFIIGSDATVLSVISPAVSMSAHADRALEFLKSRS